MIAAHDDWAGNRSPGDRYVESMEPSTGEALEQFSEPVRRWFLETLGPPTDPQRLGWPIIARGQHCLIQAPTGSGKTLAAFLVALDRLWREDMEPDRVRVLYISPLKALNEDVARNLQRPLEGIRATAERLEAPLRPLRLGVRTGDTTASARQQMRRNPPELLVTTPESLHLLLTSGAREMLINVGTVIVDEIHALCGQKRGAFLALLLERLEARIDGPRPVRIGLSATIRPLEVAARFLGGNRPVRHRDGRISLRRRPVQIVDASKPKRLDLQVSLPALEAPEDGVAESVWPGIERRLLQEIGRHRSTIVFANNRRLVERLTQRLNALAEATGSTGPRSSDIEDLNDTESTDESRLVRAHHGSLSLEERRQTESALKRGELAGVVATASLEMGIDMGAVDLVCQVESPGQVARGLQRVGRAGHVVDQASRGRLLAKTRSDLLECAALAGAMARGEVEPVRMPTQCLDVLAQQVVACVAVDDWAVEPLWHVIRQAEPFRDLSLASFERVLKLVSGQYGDGVLRDLRARIGWDRVHNVLRALPGSSQMAWSGGGTIPETGQFPVYLVDDGPRLGELDEEFVLERRPGETFALGTSTWRIDRIEPDRVLVSPAPGQPSLMPFWRGERAPRSFEMGQAIGRLTRTIVERLDDSRLLSDLEQDHYLDRPSARALRSQISRQATIAGVVPDDRTVLVEAFVDPTGETALAVLHPAGTALHHALKLVLVDRLQQRLGIEVAALHSHDGILFRVPGLEDGPPLDLLEGVTGDEAEAIVRRVLPESALFGLRFRQNADRALLFPKPDPGRRTPLWLQRLRAKDLLQAVRAIPDFPIVLETYRECLVGVLEIDRLVAFLDRINRGEIRVVTRDATIDESFESGEPSPFAAGLLLQFQTLFLYEWDEPRRQAEGKSLAVDAEGLDDLLRASQAGPLDSEAVRLVEARLRGAGNASKSAEAFAEYLRRVGDLTPRELDASLRHRLDELQAQQRVRALRLSGTREPDRWILEESADQYQRGLLDEPVDSNARLAIVQRFLRTRALVDLATLTERYPIPREEALTILKDWAAQGTVVCVPNGSASRIDGEPENGDDPTGTDDDKVVWSDTRNLIDIRRTSLARQRQEAITIDPEAYADWLVHHHRIGGPSEAPDEPLTSVMTQLRGFALPLESWLQGVLPSRLLDFRSEQLALWLDESGWSWRCRTEDSGTIRVGFVPPDFQGGWPDRLDAEEPEPNAPTSNTPELLDVEQRILTRLDPTEMAILRVLYERETATREEIAERVPDGLPEMIGTTLKRMALAGLVTARNFDALQTILAEARPQPASKPRRSVSPIRPRGGRSRLMRRTRSSREGSTLNLETLSTTRWALVPGLTVDPDSDDARSWWVEALLDRHGVLTSETVRNDRWAPPWRDLVGWLDRAEWRGRISRGYFVAGLSGRQYARTESDEQSRPRDRRAMVVSSTATPRAQATMIGPRLLASEDPASPYGSQAPFDIPLLEGGTARLPRNGSTWLALAEGRPVLLVEQGGRRLTGLSSAEPTDLAVAIGTLTRLATPADRVLKVESYNGQPAWSSAAAGWLAEAGFVRDPPAMTYYCRAGW